MRTQLSSSRLACLEGRWICVKCLVAGNWCTVYGYLGLSLELSFSGRDIILPPSYRGDSEQSAVIYTSVNVFTFAIKACASLGCRISYFNVSRRESESFATCDCLSSPIPCLEQSLQRIINDPLSHFNCPLYNTCFLPPEATETILPQYVVSRKFKLKLFPILFSSLCYEKKKKIL